MAGETPLSVRVFEILERAARNDEPRPINRDLARLFGVGETSIKSAIDHLAATGRIGRSDHRRGRSRDITLLTGPMAGRLITIERTAAVAKRSLPCAWCGKPVKRRGQGGDLSSCCSKQCDSQRAKHGYLVNKAQVEARRAHLAQQPKGCATIEEFLASGGSVYTEAPRPRA